MAMGRFLIFSSRDVVELLVSSTQASFFAPRLGLRETSRELGGAGFVHTLGQGANCWECTGLLNPSAWY